MPISRYLGLKFIPFLFVFLFWHAVQAQSDILNQAYEAHGVGALENAQTLELKTRNIDIWVGQDMVPGPPWQKSSGYRWVAVDFAKHRLADQVHMRHVGFYPSYSRRIIEPDGGYVINLQEREWFPASGGEEAFHGNTLASKLSFAPWLILDAFRDSEARVTGTPSVEGETFETVSAKLADGTAVKLYIHPGTGLLHSLERQDQPVVLKFSDYQETAGMTVNQRAALYYEGNLVQEFQLLKLALNENIETLFEIPGGFSEITRENDPDARAFRVQELDPGVWFVGEAVFYQLFVEFDDFLVAVGGIGGAEKRLEAIAEITDKPVRYAIITHHHSDHLDGVEELANAGATLIVGTGNEAVTRQALNQVETEIESVSEKRVITDGNRTLEIYQFGPGAHAESMLGVYLPDEKILYTGDLLVQPPGRAMRPRIPPIRDLVIGIETYDLDVERHVDPHSPRVTTLEEIYEAFYR